MSLFGSTLPYEDDTAASLIRQRGFPPGKAYDQMPDVYMCACCSQLNQQREHEDVAWEVMTEKEKERRRLLQLDVIEERARPPATETRCRVRKATEPATPEAAPLVEVPPPPQTTQDLRRHMPRKNHSRKLRVTIHHGTHLAAEAREPLSVVVRCGAFEGQTAPVRRGQGTRTTWDELFEFPYPGAAAVEVVLMRHPHAVAHDEDDDHADDGEEEASGHEVGGVVVPSEHLHDRRRGDEVSVPVLPLEHMNDAAYEEMPQGPLGTIWMSWRVVEEGDADTAAGTALEQPLACTFIVRRLFQYTDAEESEPYPDGVLCVLRDTDDNCSESVPYTVLAADAHACHDDAPNHPRGGAANHSHKTVPLPSLSPYYAQEGHHYVPVTANQSMQLTTNKKVGHILVCVPKDEPSEHVAGEEEEELLVLAAVPIDLARMYHRGRAVLLIESKSKEEAVWGELDVEWANVADGGSGAGRPAPLPLEVPEESLFVTVLRGHALAEVSPNDGALVPITGAVTVSVSTTEMEGSTGAEMGTRHDQSNDTTDDTTTTNNNNDHNHHRHCNEWVHHWNQEIRFVGVDPLESVLEVRVQHEGRLAAVGEVRLGAAEEEGVVEVCVHDVVNDALPGGTVVLSYRRIHPPYRPAALTAGTESAAAANDAWMGNCTGAHAARRGRAARHAYGDEEDEACEEDEEDDEEEQEEREMRGAPPELRVTRAVIHPASSSMDGADHATAAAPNDGAFHDGCDRAVLEARMLAAADPDEDNASVAAHNTTEMRTDEMHDDRHEDVCDEVRDDVHDAAHVSPMSAQEEQRERVLVGQERVAHTSSPARRECAEESHSRQRDEANHVTTASETHPSPTAHCTAEEMDTSAAAPTQSSLSSAETHESHRMRRDMSQEDDLHALESINTRRCEAVIHDYEEEAHAQQHVHHLHDNEQRDAAERSRHEREEMEREAVERDRLRRDAAERNRLEREQLEREAAECDRLRREAAERSRHEREEMEREAVERDCLRRDAAERNRLEREQLEREAAECDRLRREAAERSRHEREEMEREAAERDRLRRDAAERNRVEREQLEREAAEYNRLRREAAERSRHEREEMEREAAERDRLRRDAAERNRLEREQLEREAAEYNRLRRAAAEEDECERERMQREAAERDRLRRDAAERDAAEAAQREAAAAERRAADAAARRASEAAQREAADAVERAQRQREEAEREAAAALTRARAERAAAEKAQRERHEAELAAAEAVAAARRAREEAERAAADVYAAQRAAAERARAEEEAAALQMHHQRAAADAVERERRAREAAERDAAEREAAARAVAEREAAERAAADAAARARAEREAADAARREREAAEAEAAAALEEARLERAEAERAVAEREAAAMRGGRRDMSRPPRSNKSGVNSATNRAPEKYSRRDSSKGSLNSNNNNASDSEGIRAAQGRTSNSGRRPSSRTIDWSMPASYTSKFKKPFYPSGNPDSETHLPFEKSALSKRNEENIRSLEQYHTRLVEESAQRERSPLRYSVSENVLI